MSRTALRMRFIASCFVIAVAFTYLSLIVPGRVKAVCGNLGTPIYCPVLAYGFPLPFLADSQATSPVGSVDRDPLSILIGLDDVLWPRLAGTFSFWVFVVALSILGRRHWMRRGERAKNGAPSGKL